MADYTPPPPLNDEQIRAQVDAQIQASIGLQTAPYQTQLGQTGRDESATLGALGEEFGSILPYVAGSAERVRSDYNSALQAQTGIFAAATKRMNDLSNSRAQEAQTLAQQMGGPVAVGEFTAPTDPYMATAGSEFAGGLLHALGNATAGEQEAEAFAGQVFPAMQTEQMAGARRSYEDRKRELEDQISQITATQTAQGNALFAERQVAERSYGLQVAQQAADRLAADRAWKVSQRTLAQQDAQLEAQRVAAREGKREFGITQGETRREFNVNQKLAELKARRDWIASNRTMDQEDKRIEIEKINAEMVRVSTIAQLTGTYKGKPTLASRTQTLAEKTETAAEKAEKVKEQQAAAELANTRRGLSIQEKQQMVAGDIAQKQYTISQQKEAGELLDAATSGGKPGTYTTTQVQEVEAKTALTNSSAYAEQVRGTVDANGIITPVDPMGQQPQNAVPLYENKEYDPSKPISKDNQPYTPENNGTPYRKWYINSKVTQTVPAHAGISDPNKLYQFLLAHGIPKPIALQQVRAKTGQPNFSPGPHQGESLPDLQKRSFAELRSIALQRGWTPDPRKPATKPTLIAWLKAHGAGPMPKSSKKRK